jgi:hypothetical protein
MGEGDRMRRASWLVQFLFLLVPVHVGATEGSPAPAERQDYAYVIRSLNQTVTAGCSAEFRPDLAVVVGGITAESLKPTEAREQIEGQLNEIQKYVSQQGGNVHVMERVRAVRGMPRDPRHGRTDQLPFVVMQRLEVEFPLGVDIDETLERLLQLGLDQYGRNVRLEYQVTPPQVVVRYRFSNLAEALKTFHHQCKAKALQQWCETNAPAGEGQACGETFGAISHRFLTQSLVLQSEPIIGEHGQSTLVHIPYPWNEAQLRAIELLGDTPLRLHGTITLTVPNTRGW